MKCVNPFRTSEGFLVPCGKCAPCLKRRVHGWAFRLLKECEVSIGAQFITLTYNTDNVPITPDGKLTLRMSDVQKFLKRLRKANKHPIRYFYCGEYGTRYARPHYHMLLFNADLETIGKAWRKPGTNRMIGEIYYGDVQEGSIYYTLKYMCKEVKKLPWHDTRQKEFQCMSKGLGINYITGQVLTWHKNDVLKRIYAPLLDKRKIALPRYYKDRIYDEDDKLKIRQHVLALDQEYNYMTRAKRKELVEYLNKNYFKRNVRRYE